MSQDRSEEREDKQGGKTESIENLEKSLKSGNSFIEANKKSASLHRTAESPRKDRVYEKLPSRFSQTNSSIERAPLGVELMD